MVNKYIQYFRNLAVVHPAIQHQPHSESIDGDPRMCKFGRFWNMDLYLEKPPGGIVTEDIALHVQLFDGAIDMQTGHYDVKGDLQGGLLITKKALKNNVSSEETALVATYEVLLDILKECYDQTQPSCDSMQFEMSQIKFSQVGPIWDNRYGWWLTFNIVEPLHLEQRINPFKQQTNNGSTG